MSKEYQTKVPGVFLSSSGNWCRTCSHCGSAVEHYGQFSRIAALNSTRQKAACKYCSERVGGFGVQHEFTKKKTLERINSEHSGSSKAGEKEYEIVCYISNHQTENNYTPQSCGPAILYFKTRMLECQNCGHRKMQNVPSQFSEFRYFCHKCKSRQLAKV